MSRTEDQTDLIRRRAYALYLERGADPGRELDDWLAAEKEVRSDFKRPSQPEPVPAVQRGTAQGFASKARSFGRG
jgi:hypothetical protein